MAYIVRAETSSENNRSNAYDETINLVSACADNAGIPGELLVDILSKLPVKSLIRFKIVCKPWKLLFESPLFIDKHIHRKNPQISLYSLNTDGCYSTDDDDTVIVGTCNGIICLENNGRLLLLNPSTKEFSFLPKECYGFFFGFYYISQTQKYHVISFSYSPPSLIRFNIKVWTLGKSTCLREVKDVIVPGLICGYTQKTGGNSMYWFGRDYGEYANAIVICYDLIEERFSKMDVPPSSSSSPVRFLRVLKDSVIMFVYSKLDATSFDMWVLIDDVSKGKSWMIYRRIGPFNTCVSMIPLGVYSYGRRILCSKNPTPKNDSDKFYYNLETDQVEDYDEEAHEDFVYYVESLVSINNLVRCIDTCCYHTDCSDTDSFYTLWCYRNSYQLLRNVKNSYL